MRKAKGFTLVELMVVVAIIVVLAAALSPAIAAANTKAKAGRAAADLKAIESAIQLYKVDAGRWIGTTAVVPYNSTTGAGLDLTDTSNNPTAVPAVQTCSARLITADASVPAWDGPYIGALKIDPWGNPYHIGAGTSSAGAALPNTNLVLWSNGPDLTNNSGKPPLAGVTNYPSGTDIVITVTTDTTR